MYHKTSKNNLPFIVAISGLVLWLILSPWGYLKYRKINLELADQREENRQLARQIEDLQREIILLTKDPDHIEKTAREKYGMIRKNEIIFDFSRKSKN